MAYINMLLMRDVHESEDMVRQDMLKVEFLQGTGGWETDDAMPELEEF